MLVSQNRHFFLIHNDRVGGLEDLAYLFELPYPLIFFRLLFLAFFDLFYALGEDGLSLNSKVILQGGERASSLEELCRCASDIGLEVLHRRAIAHRLLRLDLGSTARFCCS